MLLAHCLVSITENRFSTVILSLSLSFLLISSANKQPIIGWLSRVKTDNRLAHPCIACKLAHIHKGENRASHCAVCLAQAEAARGPCVHQIDLLWHQFNSHESTTKKSTVHKKNNKPQIKRVLGRSKLIKKSTNTQRHGTCGLMMTGLVDMFCQLLPKSLMNPWSRGHSLVC